MVPGAEPQSEDKALTLLYFSQAEWSSDQQKDQHHTHLAGGSGTALQTFPRDWSYPAPHAGACWKKGYSPRRCKEKRL